MPSPYSLAHLATRLDPATIQTAALDLIDQQLDTVATTPGGRLIISMPPQEGKSTRAARCFPIWRLIRNPATRIVIASYAQDLAREHGKWIRNQIAIHPELRLRVADGSAAQDAWRTTGGGGVKAVGVGTALTGNPADLLIIDDPIKDRTEADSPTYRDRVWSWWTDTASTRLAPGAPVILILTRWHEDDLAGRLLAATDGHLWRHINIPAMAETTDDPLGRTVGEYLDSARQGRNKEWDAIRTRVGARAWNALYQGRPAPAEGGILKRDWWHYWHTPPPVNDPATVVCQSWDLAFKDHDQADYVVGQVWAKTGADLYLLDQVRGRWGFSETCRQLEALTVKWPQAIAKLVEDKANGPAVIDALKHRIPGLIPVNPDGSKTARAEAITPILEAGNVHLPHPSIAPWVATLVEEAATFPNAANDDQIDALTQAVTRLTQPPARRLGTTIS